MQQDFKYIYQLYLDGSFSKAAENLYLTQPALSIAIQKIEASMGMPLFDRSKRPLKLTQAGEIYIQAIKKMQDLEYDLDQQINDIQQLNTGTIRLGGSHYLNAYILPQILSGFSKEYPGIRFEIIEESSDVLSDMLSERKIDLTFSCNPAFMKDFERYEIFYDHILLAVPKSHPINQKVFHAALTPWDVVHKKHLKQSCPDVPFEKFRELEYILLTPGNNLYDRALGFFQEAGFEPMVKLQLSQLATAYHLAANDFAATFISDRMIRNTEVPLLFYKINSDLAKRLFYILLPNRNYTSFAVKRFIQYFLLNVQPAGSG